VVFARLLLFFKWRKIALPRVSKIFVLVATGYVLVPLAEPDCGGLHSVLR